MKLIIEKLCGELYAYMESEDNHRENQKVRDRNSAQLDIEKLNEECNLRVLLSGVENCHFVFDLLDKDALHSDPDMLTSSILVSKEATEEEKKLALERLKS